MSAPTPLILYGAGPLAGEVLEAVRAAAEEEQARTEVVGLVDDDPTREGEVAHGVPVLGTPDVLADHPNARVVICTGSPRNWWSRLLIAEQLSLEPERFATVVHPSATLPPGTAVGHGSVVMAGCVATAPVPLGAHVLVMPGAILTHDDEVGDGATFASGVRLGGGVVVGTGAYLGAGTLVREHTRIGEYALVGMGAVVLDDVGPGEIHIGSPARLLRPANLPTGLPGRVDA